MSRKMLVNAMHPEEARVAIVEDGKLVELDIEIAGSEQTRGNVYKGVVVRVEPSLQAAFIDIGLKKLGFLQMGELHPDNWQWRDDIPEEQRHRRPRIQEVLRRGQELVLQVEKGERDMKGAALTTYISLPGRYIVLMPGSDSSGISRKVEGEGERKKIKEMIAKLEIPEGMGYIVRTEAVGKTKAELTRDLAYQMKLYAEIKEHGVAGKAPSLIYQETDLITRTLRDYFTAEIDEVLVDSKDALKQIKAFFKTTMPKYEKLVKLHLEKRPIFSKYQLEEQIDHIYEKKVPLPSGGSIVIEPTEALVSIDVNSGKSTGEKGVEDTAFRTNLEAADEVARQLRLRDLGGLIVIDFIDMRDRKHISDVEHALKDALKKDKARVTVGKISQFGIMEMSRQRIKQAIEQAVNLECPHCSGRGKVKSVESMALSFLRKVHAAAAKGNAQEVHGELPLEVAYYLLNCKKRELARIEDEYDISVTIKGKPSFLMNQLALETIKREKPSHAHNELVDDLLLPEILPDAPRENPVVVDAAPSEEDGGKKKQRRSRGKKKNQLPVETGEQEVLPGAEEESVFPEEPATSLSDESDDVEALVETADGEHKKKRRRRRRKKKSDVATDSSAGGPVEAEPAETVAIATVSEALSGADAAPELLTDESELVVKKKRRRRKKKKPDTALLSTPGASEPATDPIAAAVHEAAAPLQSPEPVIPAPKRPSRSRRAASGDSGSAEPAAELLPQEPSPSSDPLPAKEKKRPAARKKKPADEPESSSASADLPAASPPDGLPPRKKPTGRAKKSVVQVTDLPSGNLETLEPSGKKPRKGRKKAED